LKPETVRKVYARLGPTATENIAPRRRMRDARAPARAIAMIEMSYQRS
jgi:hypothetical protein